MPIKLDDQSEGLLPHLRLNRAGVKEMVDFHRNNPPKAKLKLAHFELKEVLELLRDNGVIDFKIPLNDQLSNFESFGVKLYPGIHSKPLVVNGVDYEKHSSIIICTTKVDESSGKFLDMLTDKKDSISVAGFGLDFAQVCPPDCKNTDDVAT